MFVAIDKFELSNKQTKKNLEFWETRIRHPELESFPKLKEFSDDTGGDTNKCDF